MKAIRILRLLIVLVVASAAAGLAYMWYISPDADNLTIHGATVKEVKDMVRLCSMEIYDEVPVKGHVGPRHLFAKMQLKGTVNFDLEKITADLAADTVRIALPPEEVEVLESTDEHAYVVIDTWNDDFLGSDHFTTAEENSMKAKVRAGWLRRIYTNGSIARARAEAVANLSAMLSGILHKPVIVTDPTPQGTLPHTASR
ncbi:MAG: hypothetical protein NC406_02700 [Bacteroides sp.]|nr:hypothetical protein [Bacteroides sp.]MCM1094908.1 hypothetical protein [Terasakiella sp.]